jgi:uncharacterized protein (DUF488 family)
VPDLVTFGHSTRTQDELLRLLHGHGVTAVADVRAFPQSRRHPHVAMEELERWLPDAGIAYRHFPALGGRRRPLPDSPNTGWRNSSFRGFADYMATDDFRAALDDLLAWAAAFDRTALMCSEAVPWRCHRSLIADALLARGIVVGEVIGTASPRPHKLTPFGQVDGVNVFYPQAQELT